MFNIFLSIIDCDTVLVLRVLHRLCNNTNYRCWNEPLALGYDCQCLSLSASVFHVLLVSKSGCFRHTTSQDESIYRCCVHSSHLSTSPSLGTTQHPLHRALCFLHLLAQLKPRHFSFTTYKLFFLVAHISNNTSHDGSDYTKDAQEDRFC